MRRGGADPTLLRYVHVYLPFAVLTSAAVGCLAIWLLLRYGNPQWNRHIYIYQAWHMGDTNYADQARPEDYTGTWRRWSRDGSRDEIEYRNGEPLKMTCWDADGHRTFQREVVQLERGAPVEIWRFWHSNGRLKAITHCRNEKLHGRKARWERDGRPICDGVYRDGRPWQGTFIGVPGEGGLWRPMILTYDRGRLVGQRPFDEGGVDGENGPIPDDLPYELQISTREAAGPPLRDTLPISFIARSEDLAARLMRHVCA